MRAGTDTTEDGRVVVLSSGGQSGSQSSVSSSTITNCILLFMLFLVFLCMVALAVALCRVGRIEKSLDMMTLMQAKDGSGGRSMAPSMVGGGAYSYIAPPPLYSYSVPPSFHSQLAPTYSQPIQLPIAPPRSYITTQ